MLSQTLTDIKGENTLLAIKNKSLQKELNESHKLYAKKIRDLEELVGRMCYKRKQSYTVVSKASCVSASNKQHNESTIKYAKPKQHNHSCIYQSTIERDPIFRHKSKVVIAKTPSNNYMTSIKKSLNMSEHIKHSFI